MFQLHYPELLRRMVLINCPKMFYVLWAAVKPFIREATRDKMIIVGSKCYIKFNQLKIHQFGSAFVLNYKSLLFAQKDVIISFFDVKLKQQQNQQKRIETDKAMYFL